MARKKPTATQKLRKNILSAIKRREKKGQSYETLKNSIEGMNWRELKKLSSIRKGKATYKELEKWQDTQPSNEPEYELSYPEASDTDIGITSDQLIVDNLMHLINKLEGSTPRTTATVSGREVERGKWDYNASDMAKNELLQIVNSVINQIGVSGLAQRLENTAEDLGALIDTMLMGYGDKIVGAFVRLATIIQGGSLTMAQSNALTYDNFDEYE